MSDAVERLREKSARAARWRALHRRSPRRAAKGGQAMKTEKARRVRAEFYRSLAVELESHIGNGSGFLYIEPDGSDSTRGAVSIREGILNRAIAMFEKRAWQLERKIRGDR